MNLAESDNSDLLSLFNYVGKKFSRWEEIDTSWSLNINEPLNFPVGALYARDYDQAGTEYWFYDGVLSYGMYVWCLLGAVCSVITIKKGKHTDDSGTFFLEENTEEFPQKLSVCSELFAPILNLSTKDFNTQTDLVKEASKLLEGVASFFEAKGHEYCFALNESFFPKYTVDKCELSFDVWQGEIDGIYLSITEEARNETIKVWQKEEANNA